MGNMRLTKGIELHNQTLFHEAHLVVWCSWLPRWLGLHHFLDQFCELVLARLCRHRRPLSLQNLFWLCVWRPEELWTGSWWCFLEPLLSALTVRPECDLEHIAADQLSCLNISNVRALFNAKSMALCFFLLLYCSGARDFVCSATFIIVLPTCLKVKLQSTGNNTIVHRPERSVTPDFFSSITSRQYFQRLGAKPIFKGSLVIEHSRAAMAWSNAPAFIVEKQSADGKHAVSSRAFLQKDILESKDRSIFNGPRALTAGGICHCAITTSSLASRSSDSYNPAKAACAVDVSPLNLNSSLRGGW